MDMDNTENYSSYPVNIDQYLEEFINSLPQDIEEIPWQNIEQKKKRKYFTIHQLKILLEYYYNDKMFSKNKIAVHDVVCKSGLTKSQILNWARNRR